MKYLSQIITNTELSNIEKGKFNILKAPRGCGKTTFMFDDRILSFARSKKNIIYLVHNKITRDFIAKHHPEVAEVYDDNASRWIYNFSNWSEQKNNKVQVMCYQTFSAIIKNEGVAFLENIDLIVWDEFDDIRKYLLQEVKELKKKLPKYSNEKLLALLEEGNLNSVAHFIYEIKTLILDPEKTTLLAVSATPDLAATIFADYVNYILEGKIEEIFDAKQTYYIETIAAALKNKMLIADGNHRFWCYTPYIQDILRIEELAKQCGFHTLSLWSKENKKYQSQWTEEKEKAIESIQDKGIVPLQYDFIIVNDVIGRSVDVLDTSIQDWLCNSSNYEDVGQFIRARFCPERKYLLNSAFGLMDFKEKGFSSTYYDWHSVKELRNLMTKFPLLDINNKPYKSWNSFVKENPFLIEKRTYGSKHTIQYRLKEGEIKCSKT